MEANLATDPGGKTAGQRAQQLLADALPFPRALLLLALLSVVVGRGLAQALPGTRVGIDRVIGVTQLLGAHLSQLAALLLVMVCGRIVLLLVFARQGGLLLRTLSCLATLGASGLALVASLTQERLAPTVLAVVSILAVSTLAWTGVGLVQRVEKRAVGLVLIAAALSAGTHALGRFINFVAGDRADASLFALAQVVSTSGFVFEVGCISSGFLWLLTARVTWLRAVTAVLVVCAPALALAADQPGTWQAMLKATLAQMGSHPDPLVPLWATRSAEICALGASSLALIAPRRRPELLFAVALALLGRASPDFPLGALFLISAALGAQLPLPDPVPAGEPRARE